MHSRRLITGSIAGLLVAGALVAPSVLAAPWVGQYVGLYGEVSVDGTDGAAYRLAVEVTRPAKTVNLGTQPELRLDITRCAKGRCVEIGHHLKPLLADELTIADDFHSGSLRTVFAGHVVSGVWSDPTPNALPEVNGFYVEGVGTDGPPYPGVTTGAHREAYSLQLKLDLGVVACTATEAYGFEESGADTVGRDLRETRTPEPLRLPAGLERRGSRTPRCTPAPKPKPKASPSPSASPTPSSSATPKPSGPLATKRQIVEIRRTRKSGIAVLALAGRITAADKPGFFAALDVYRDAGEIRGIPTPRLVDFGLAQEPTQYGHGSDRPLCNLPLVCILSKAGGELSFTMTVTDDTRTNDEWQGRTHYLLLEGTGFELESAAVGFSVTKRSGGFDRRTAVDSDADGVAVLGAHAEVFRAASILGGPKGSVVVAQLPCEGGGNGVATLSHDSDKGLAVASPMSCEINAGAGGRVNPDWQVRAASVTKPGAWHLEGAVAGVTSTLTRLLVMNL